MLDRALANHPDDLAARQAKALALALSGHRSEGIQLEQSVLKSAPKYEEALDACLALAIEQGDIPSALAAARQAVALNPWSAAFHERLAHLSLRRQDWTIALSEARQALQLNPFLPFARMFVIQCLLHQEDHPHAEEEFATLTRLNPTRRPSLQRWFAARRRSHGS
jgi:tetratricopeptide (TPR) repeat protein